MAGCDREDRRWRSGLVWLSQRKGDNGDGGGKAITTERGRVGHAPRSCRRCSEGVRGMRNVCRMHAIEAYDRAPAIDYGAAPSGPCARKHADRRDGADQRLGVWSSRARRTGRSETGREPSVPRPGAKVFRELAHPPCRRRPCVGGDPSCRRSTIPLQSAPTRNFPHALPANSPTRSRHGAGTNAMDDPLEGADDVMPEPRWVMVADRAVRADRGGKDACGTGLDGVLPVDVDLPGARPTRRDHGGAAHVLERAPQRFRGGRLSGQ